MIIAEMAAGESGANLTEGRTDTYGEDNNHQNHRPQGESAVG